MNTELAKWATSGGVFALLLASLAMFVLYRACDREEFTKPWVAAEVFVLIAGVALGSALFKLELLVNPSLRTLGFPFVAGVFELHDGLWVDYVGPLTIPTCALNFLVGVMVAHIPFALALQLYLWFKPKKLRA